MFSTKSHEEIVSLQTSYNRIGSSCASATWEESTDSWTRIHHETQTCSLHTCTSHQRTTTRVPKTTERHTQVSSTIQKQRVCSVTTGLDQHLVALLGIAGHGIKRVTSTPSMISKPPDIEGGLSFLVSVDLNFGKDARAFCDARRGPRGTGVPERVHRGQHETAELRGNVGTS